MKIIDINSIPSNLSEVDKEIIGILKRDKRKWYMIGFCLIFLATASSFWFFYLRAAKNLKAQDVFQAIYHFEAGGFDKALKGDGLHKGFLEVIKQYSNTATANLTCFYVGVAYMQQKEYDQARFLKKRFKARDYILQALAWCVVGDAYSEQKIYKQYAIYYK